MIETVKSFEVSITESLNGLICLSIHQVIDLPFGLVVLDKIDATEDHRRDQKKLS